MMYLKLMAILIPTMLIIDAIWIGGIMKNFYRGNLGFIMADTINWKAAIVFYILYIFGLVYFIVLPSLAGMSLGETFVRGALFGLVAYGTYDLTNHATLANWPWAVTVVDMAWGATLTGVVAAVGHYFGKILS